MDSTLSENKGKQGDLNEKDYLDYAWKHFNTHADQRLKTFNFYIILLAGLTAATVSGFDKTRPFGVMLLCGTFHIICPTIFFIIDQRSKRLIGIPKNVLIGIEEKNKWELFTEDERLQESFWRSISTYTIAFRMAFICQACLGILVLFYAFASQNEPDQPKQPEIRLPAMPRTQLPRPSL